MPEARLLVVLVLLVGFVAARAAYGAWRHRVAGDDAPVPRLPGHMVEGADRTWVVFTTPYCGSCGPVADRLRTNDPAARVVTVDATERRDLADAFRIRTAPTVLLADGAGDVHTRLVGAAAVEGYFQ